EDRFYAILPHSKYKDKINQVAHWNITTLLSVKLKLFEIMDTKDKLTLLFSNGERDNYASNSLPTFAAPKIKCLFDLSDELSHRSVNFDLNNKSTISIHHRAHESQLDYYLQLTPKKYSVSSKPHYKDTLGYTLLQQEILCSHFQLDEHSLEIDIVRIDLNESSGNCYSIYLTGSFLENIWMLPLSDTSILDCTWNDYHNDDTVTVFNIY
ncbi:hypothetical protein BCR42DRAFT_426074, partial [Absidia repens]